jgi:alpha-amylase/alpha-mannosidase (GH57 family)
MERYVCVHGHFYQPPRENPWLEAVELQDSARPYHDWNQRITAECYAANAASRILDPQGRIERLQNNYARMSFNFGPTLLSWMDQEAPGVSRAIVQADLDSRERFGGHGSALAQAYNHLIMPLANQRDRRTQVIWGLEDFRGRFGREPEGMWLPEAAVDADTLELLAEFGLRFTVLAPRQAARVRPLGGGEWEDVGGGRVDPTRAYLARLPSGREIALFFYDGPISQAVAFEGLLESGEKLMERVKGGFSDQRHWPQLMHLATDGETYGHHHRKGEMALAYALDGLERDEALRLTNYGQYLELHPPEWEVEVFENSSWSCVHGVERWRADCGCSSGGRAGWHQKWRAPLREALDWLRDRVAAFFVDQAAGLLTDPWQARDAYIRVINDRSPQGLAGFLQEQAGRELDNQERVQALRLLEMQRHALLMYTSCGWFFDELSGIETVQVMQYAARCLQLAEEVTGQRLEEQFLARLEKAPSNLAAHPDGRAVYQRFVQPARIGLSDVAAHYALSTIFEEFAEETGIYCYRVTRHQLQHWDAGRVRLAVGRARLSSAITTQAEDLCFAALHWGDHNLSGNVCPFPGEAAHRLLQRRLSEAFTRADFTQTQRLMDQHLGGRHYSLRSLFRDQQRKVLDIILESTQEQAQTAHRQLYQQHSPLLRFLHDLGAPAPASLAHSAHLVINHSLRQALAQPRLDYQAVEELLEEARLVGVELDRETLEFTLRRTLERLAAAWEAQPESLEPLDELQQALGLVRGLPFWVVLWEVQNVCYRIGREQLADKLQASQAGDKEASRWMGLYRAVAEHLGLTVPEGA